MYFQMRNMLRTNYQNLKLLFFKLVYFQANGFRSSEVTLAFGGFFKDPSFKQVIWPYPYYTQIQMPDYISFRSFRPWRLRP